MLDAPCAGGMRKRSRCLFLAALALWEAKDAFLSKATLSALPLRSLPEEISEGSKSSASAALETFRDAPRNADARWRTAAVLNISRNETITCAAARELMNLACCSFKMISNDFNFLSTYFSTYINLFYLKILKDEKTNICIHLPTSKDQSMVASRREFWRGPLRLPKELERDFLDDSAALLITLDTDKDDALTLDEFIEYASALVQLSHKEDREASQVKSVT